MADVETKFLPRCMWRVTSSCSISEFEIVIFAMRLDAEKKNFSSQELTSHSRDAFHSALLVLFLLSLFSVSLFSSSV